jgi:hypothetical protein
MRESLSKQLKHLIWFHPKFARSKMVAVSLESVTSLRSKPFKRVIFDELDELDKFFWACSFDKIIFFQERIEFKSYLFPPGKMVSHSRNSYLTLRASLAKELYRFSGICDTTELTAFNFKSPNFVMNRY